MIPRRRNKTGFPFAGRERPDQKLECSGNKRFEGAYDIGFFAFPECFSVNELNTGGLSSDYKSQLQRKFRQAPSRDRQLSQSHGRDISSSPSSNRTTCTIHIQASNHRILSRKKVLCKSRVLQRTRTVRGRGRVAESHTQCCTRTGSSSVRSDRLRSFYCCISTALFPVRVSQHHKSRFKYRSRRGAWQKAGHGVACV